MKQLVCFAFVVVLSMITTANGLKCHECSVTNNQDPNACKAERECPLPYDSCMYMRTFSQMDIVGNVMNMTMEMRNCSVYAVNCNEGYKQQICSIPNIKSCDYSCCRGDLCNTGVGPQPTFEPKPAANLSCYECSPEGMGPNGTGEPLISCKTPRKRKCGEVGPGMPFDQCVTVKTSVKNPQTGAILDQEYKNCTLSSMKCSKNMYCKNDTGIVAKCEVECCEGNLCNGDQPVKPTTTTAGPTAGPTAGQTSLATSSILAILAIMMALLFK